MRLAPALLSGMFTYIIMDSTLHVPDCNLPLSPGNSSHDIWQRLSCGRGHPYQLEG